MPDRDSSYLSSDCGSATGGGEEGSSSAGSSTGSTAGASSGNGSASGSMGGGTELGDSNGCGSSSGTAGAAQDGICRDFIRNVCKRGKRCRYRHPDVDEVPDLGVQKNEFIFCHDYQNKDCMRINCRFVHGSKEEEEYYKKTGELPLTLIENVAARFGLSPTDLPNSRCEVPLCRDYLKGDCLRGMKCKFRHVQKDYEYEASRVVGAIMAQSTSTVVNAGGVMGGGAGVCVGMQGLVGGGNAGSLMGAGCPSLGGATMSGVGGVVGGGLSSCLSISATGQRRTCSVYDPLLEGGLLETSSFETSMDHTGLQMKRRRLEGFRLTDGGVVGHYDLGAQASASSRPAEYRLLEEENSLLRKRVEELKKQVSNLIATNDILLEQNAQFRSQAKVMTLSSTPAPGEQTLAPPVGAVSSYNHSIAQTHTTLSNAGLQPRPVTQQDLVAPTGAPAAPPTNVAPPLNPEITPLSAALAQTIAQGMAPPVSMSQVAVSVAPVAVSMTQPLPGITMSHATTPMVSYPIASQSMRITSLPH